MKLAVSLLIVAYLVMFTRDVYPWFRRGWTMALASASFFGGCTVTLIEFLK